MSPKYLHPKAWVAFTVTGLFCASESLCSLFVGVYLWVNSHDLGVICRFHICAFGVTGVVFLLSGWYAQVRDRLHVYRAGLVLHALYYGLLLWMGERAAQHEIALGCLLGVVWGVFYAGANTVHFDVTSSGRREYFFGVLNAVSNSSRLIAPPIGGLVITYAPDSEAGYYRLFMVVIGLYLAAYALSFLLPADTERQPFHLKRAMFPPKAHRDWRYMVLSAGTMAGSFNIIPLLLGLAMYMETSDELRVGGYASYQALVAIAVSYGLGSYMTPKHRKAFMFWAAWLLVAGGLLFIAPVTATGLIVFGFMRSASAAMFDIGYFSLRVEVIQTTMSHPAERIAYLCAWEFPLAVVRVAVLLLLLGLAHFTGNSEWAIRIVFVMLCLFRLLTYWCAAQTDHLRQPRLHVPEVIAELEAKTPTGA